jgi:mRNA interferase RelE/StbE
MFTIRYDVHIPDDIARIPRSLQVRLRVAIETKLVERPEVFGKPLRHSLLGFRSIRVGEYRVVYLIRGQEVLVVVIAHRKHVYELADRRVS